MQPNSQLELLVDCPAARNQGDRLKHKSSYSKWPALKVVGEEKRRC